MDRDMFKKMIMPGLTKEEQERTPGNFKAGLGGGRRPEELLNSPLYATALEAAVPRVVENAARVLEGVKERGRKEGTPMDTATEEVLKPQV
ncbi:unnamed protein product [Discosporangium mesarthrocarpum]